MGDDEGNARAKKGGIVAIILAAFGGLAKLGDDCGRAAVGVAEVGDDVVRSGSKLGGLGDDVARGGSKLGGLGDDALRGGSKLGGVAADGTHGLRLGEGPLANVVDDVAPGAGTSIEETLAEHGADIAIEVLGNVGPADDDEPPARSAAPSLTRAGAAVPVIVTEDNPAHVDDVEGALTSGLAVIVGRADARGEVQWGEHRGPELHVHQRCASVGLRCVVLTCRHDAAPDCIALAARLGRTAAAHASDAGPKRRQTAVLARLLQDRDVVAGGNEVAVSRGSGGGKVVRSTRSSVTAELGDD